MAPHNSNARSLLVPASILVATAVFAVMFRYEVRSGGGAVYAVQDRWTGSARLCSPRGCEPPVGFALERKKSPSAAVRPDKDAAARKLADEEFERLMRRIDAIAQRKTGRVDN